MTMQDTDAGARLAGDCTADAGRTAADWLGHAAAPVFAVMAVASGLTDGDMPGAICGAGSGASPLGGMAAMYVLITVFHLAPWLRLAVRWTYARPE